MRSSRALQLIKHEQALNNAESSSTTATQLSVLCFPFPTKFTLKKNPFCNCIQKKREKKDEKGKKNLITCLILKSISDEDILWTDRLPNVTV